MAPALHSRAVFLGATAALAAGLILRCAPISAWRPPSSASPTPPLHRCRHCRRPAALPPPCQRRLLDARRSDASPPFLPSRQAHITLLQAQPPYERQPAPVPGGAARAAALPGRQQPPPAAPLAPARRARCCQARSGGQGGCGGAQWRRGGGAAGCDGRGGAGAGAEPAASAALVVPPCTRLACLPTACPSRLGPQKCHSRRPFSLPPPLLLLLPLCRASGSAARAPAAAVSGDPRGREAGRVLLAAGRRARGARRDCAPEGGCLSSHACWASGWPSRCCCIGWSTRYACQAALGE